MLKTGVGPLYQRQSSSHGIKIDLREIQEEYITQSASFL